jgi:hypothetical protein
MVVLAQLVAMMMLQLFNLELKIFRLKTNIISDAYHMLFEQIDQCHLSCLLDYSAAALERPG